MDNPIRTFAKKTCKEQNPTWGKEAVETTVTGVLDKVLERLKHHIEQNGVDKLPRLVAIPNLAREFNETFTFLSEREARELAELSLNLIGE